MKRALIAGLTLAALAPPITLAGAWPQPEGELLFITTSSRQIAPVSSLFGGVPDRDSNAASLFVEYGLTASTTVGLTAFGEFSTTEDAIETRIGGHVRHQIWSGNAGDVLSLQLSASFPVERWLGNGLGDNRPNSATEVDFRVLYGRGVQWDWGDSFVSGELGMRIRSEGLDEEIRADVTVGHSPLDGVLGLFSVFSAFPLGNRQDPSLKLAPSIAYTLWPLVGSNDKKPGGPLFPNTLQLGIVWDALDPEDGVTLQLSIWKRF